ncbi:AlpA family phage regulatory protein [Enterobacter hormaechei subsp. xiangfangensis]|jgi:predicted DNA-binding transcriptional regulator AlpA|uniref:helix-turn-helix transcriptional regulator n=1 Tax=Enterobacter cloacae complex TaxID=354276 RepID=UPI001B37185E|nr:helix-turn-helix domain-containing protein [Enterobacter ludwigii]MCU2360323.1 AlpA family phage regulatory protein [Enterobacter hormaechei subsp. xiangfangensis]HCM9716723.1 AlpA family phage regulatory protein [Enterobacter kobei]MBQ0228661.1 AlpA family phage regulatory protein [Enterobacter ludwigii]MCU2750123.1 AlpA family phage regulatory protein [Enterobacter hormaechei subsp. xiangfangensis]MCU2995004.1 AlpA family phage regulatory protein [Enterobacter hormaechei subsp. xiangfange
MEKEKEINSLLSGRYIRRFRLPEILGVSMPTVDRWVKNGILPRPVKLSDNVTAFDAQEINRWLQERRKAN